LKLQSPRTRQHRYIKGVANDTTHKQAEIYNRRRDGGDADCVPVAGVVVRDFLADGNRKFVLGVLYGIGGFGCILATVLKGSDAGVIAAVAAACLSLATGLGVIVWGNVQEHRAKNGS